MFLPDCLCAAFEVYRYSVASKLPEKGGITFQACGQTLVLLALGFLPDRYRAIQKPQALLAFIVPKIAVTPRQPEDAVARRLHQLGGLRRGARAQRPRQQDQSGAERAAES